MRITNQLNNENLTQLSKLNQLARFIYEANSQNDSKVFMNISNGEVQTFLQSLSDHEVQYMLVGGLATVFHGYIRTTQDLNLWIKESPENKKRLVKALEEIGVEGVSNYEKVQMIHGWSSIRIGESGFEADFMSYLKAFSQEDFDKCYQRELSLIISQLL